MTIQLLLLQGNGRPSAWIDRTSIISTGGTDWWQVIARGRRIGNRLRISYPASIARRSPAVAAGRNRRKWEVKARNNPIGRERPECEDDELRRRM